MQDLTHDDNKMFFDKSYKQILTLAMKKKMLLIKVMIKILLTLAINICYLRKTFF